MTKKKILTDGFVLNENDGSYEKREDLPNSGKKRLLLKVFKGKLIIEGAYVLKNNIHRVQVTYDKDLRLVKIIQVSQTRNKHDINSVFIFNKEAYSYDENGLIKRKVASSLNEEGAHSDIQHITPNGKLLRSEKIAIKLCLNCLPFKYDDNGEIKHKKDLTTSKELSAFIEKAYPKIREKIKEIWNDTLPSMKEKPLPNARKTTPVEHPEA